jgi:alanine dehydrogenase
LADKGFRQAVQEDPVLAKGVNVVRGAVVRPEVALAHGLRPGSLADL